MRRLTFAAVVGAALLLGAVAAFLILRTGLWQSPRVAANPVSSGAAVRPSDPTQVALVIGNGSYVGKPLANPVSDARMIARVLREFGFVVIEKQNLSQTEMRQAVRQFGDRLQKGGTALFYYAGHGVQFKGRNYLIPVSADIRHEDEIEDQAVDANLVLAKMDSAKSRFNIVILDACRNNPFAKSFRLPVPGLAQMEAPARTLVAFATAPGQLAEDGEGGNGLYTRHLLANMLTPGLKLEDVFKRTRAAVREESEGRQVPWENTSLESDFYFGRPVDDPSAAKMAARPEAAPPKPTQAQTAAHTPPSGAQAPQALKAPSAASAAPHGASSSMPPLAIADRSLRNDAVEELIAAYRRSDHSLAFRLALPLAERGHPQAQFYLAEMYRLGQGVAASSADAIEWYRRSAEQRNISAQEWLGKIYVTGLGVARDYPEAIKWFHRAADGGSALAQNELGKMFRDGLTGARSDADAQHWFEKAAMAGNLEAQYNLQLLRSRSR
jgi:uncharacterized caspase-like protein